MIQHVRGVLTIHSPSELRKLHESVADPKYDGVKTSRHQLHANADQSEEDVDGSQSGSYGEEETLSMHGDSLSSAPEDEESHLPMPNGPTMPMTESKVSPQQDRDSKILPNGDEPLTSSLQRTRIADKLKGKAVSRQLVRL